MRMRDHFPELSTTTKVFHQTLNQPEGRYIDGPPKKPEPVHVTPQWLLNLTPAQMTAVEFAVNSFDTMADAITQAADYQPEDTLMNKIAEALKNDK